MTKRIKSKKSIVDIAKSDQKLNKYLIAFPVIALLIKLIVIFNIQAVVGLVQMEKITWLELTVY